MLAYLTENWDKELNASADWCEHREHFILGVGLFLVCRQERHKLTSRIGPSQSLCMGFNNGKVWNHHSHYCDYCAGRIRIEYPVLEVHHHDGDGRGSHQVPLGNDSVHLKSRELYG